MEKFKVGDIVKVSESYDFHLSFKTLINQIGYVLDTNSKFVLCYFPLWTDGYDGFVDFDEVHFKGNHCWSIHPDDLIIISQFPQEGELIQFKNGIIGQVEKSNPFKEEYFFTGFEILTDKGFYLAEDIDTIITKKEKNRLTITKKRRWNYLEGSEKND